MNGDKPKQPASDQGDAEWQYKPDSRPVNMTPLPQQTYTPQAEQSEIIWSASEFVAHQKSAGWFGLLALIAAALSLVVYVLTKDTISVGIIIFVALILGIAGVRKPRVLNYQLNRSGLTIGQKFYPYHEFKSFAVMEEGAFSSITFVPMRRFMPPLSIYYAPEDEGRIIEALSQYLPMEHRNRDVVDSLIRHIRF